MTEPVYPRPRGNSMASASQIMGIISAICIVFFFLPGGRKHKCFLRKEGFLPIISENPYPDKRRQTDGHFEKSDRGAGH